HTSHYRLGTYGKMGDPYTTMRLAEDLKMYIQETLSTDSNYMTLIAVFDDEASSEVEFEEKLWLQLQKLHDADKDSDWDEAVSKSPEDPNFSFSFNGSASFVVGLHPQASRKARQFSRTAMAFNLHYQFEKLREL